jgi:hypothetical protein
MKDWPKEWKVIAFSKKVSKGKKQAEAGPSQNLNSPAVNTRKAMKCTKETGGTGIIINPRHTNPIPKHSVQEKDHAEVRNGGV